MVPERTPWSRADLIAALEYWTTITFASATKKIRASDDASRN
jgi:hypothetical protein